tara:strand:+ start:62 stop:262 length:201 start_codon:yes stop_codon:yes gene_type:complete
LLAALSKKTSGVFFHWPSGDQILQFEEVGKCRAVVELAGAVDGSAVSTGHHLASSVLGVPTVKAGQ